ncbi:hypothetical protein F4861DRAFT_482472 [Xylaria intraflava]|nr:hypothetical protein F4861DRAFT_482472 [Xylaria intraflava]
MTGDNDAEDPAQYLGAACFDQKFTLPTSDSRPAELNVTYADFGHHNDECVLLFCGPLVGSRYVLASKDKLAKQHGIRIISPDRPGFGGTTDAGPADRIRVWLDMVEALLQHLGIKHVSIVGYSGGSVYAMNVLLHLRHLLHPTRPYVALCAPWVHPSRSNVSMLKLAGLLPGALVGSYDRLLLFIVRNIAPAVQLSSDLIGQVPSLNRESQSEYMAPGADPDAVALEESLVPHLVRRVSREDVQGLGQDALLLIKRDKFPGCWGTWGDYDALVPLLAQVESERRVRQTADSNTVAPLTIDVFFAESDNMIGDTTGPAWFNNCWRTEQRGDQINYSSVVIPKTTHNNILDLRYGVIERVFQGIPK